MQGEENKTKTYHHHHSFLFLENMRRYYIPEADFYIKGTFKKTKKNYWKKNVIAEGSEWLKNKTDESLGKLGAKLQKGIRKKYDN